MNENWRARLHDDPDHIALSSVADEVALPLGAHIQMALDVGQSYRLCHRYRHHHCDLVAAMNDNDTATNIILSAARDPGGDGAQERHERRLRAMRMLHETELTVLRNCVIAVVAIVVFFAVVWAA